VASGKQFRLAILGCGAIAQEHLKAAASLNEIKPVAFCDTALERADAIAATVGAKSYSDCAELLANENLDGVVVCSPPSVHREMVLACLEHRIPVLCEKPLADTAESAAEMVQASTEANVLLMTAFVHRFTDLTREIRAMLDSGKLGRILLAEFSMMMHLDIGVDWHGTKKVAGGGVFADSGVHLVDLIRYLFGEIASVTGSFSRFFPNTDVEDTGAMLIRTESGPLCCVSMSFAAPQGLVEHFRLFGTEGALTGALFEGIQYKLRDDAEWTRVATPDHFKAFVVQLKHFVKCARGESEPLVTAEDGWRATALIEAAYRAATEGRWVSL
jgi:predicted dehydrogenase